MPAFITIYGNLGRDPEMRSLPSGDPLLSFSVAVSHWNSKDKTESTSWFRVTVFGRYAETLKELQKGDVVLVNGDLELREYQAQDGTKRTSAEITARSVKNITRQMRSRLQGGGGQHGSDSASEGHGGGWSQPSSRPAPQRAAEPQRHAGGDTEDDLPF